MIVKCISLSIASKKDSEAQTQEVVELDIGRDYLVHCVDINPQEGAKYYVSPSQEWHFPPPYQSELFEIVCSNIPDGWRIHIGQPVDEGVSVRVAPDYWFEFPDFYERLVDGDPDAMEIFSLHRNR
jgi:hypothetical protein